MYQLPEPQVDRIIDLALAEDTSHGDLTSEILIPHDLQGKASILVKASGVLAGIEIARKIFLKVDPSLQFEVFILIRSQESGVRSQTAQECKKGPVKTVS